MAEVPFPVPGVEEQEMLVEEADQDEDDDDKNKKIKVTNTAILSRKRPRRIYLTVKPVAEVANIQKATDTETLCKFNK